MHEIVLLFASLWEAGSATRDWHEELMPNILYAITSEDVLRARVDQRASDERLAAYLWTKGIDTTPYVTDTRLAEEILLARDIYSYCRAYHYQRAKELLCN